MIYHGITNTNGKLLINYAEEANMKVTNTHFKKRIGKHWTFMSDTNCIKTQVDYILIRNKWKNSVKNCEAYSNFSSIGSEHRIITVNIRISLRYNVTQKKRINYDWSMLRDPKICKEYSKQVKHTYK